MSGGRRGRRGGGRGEGRTGDANERLLAGQVGDVAVAEQAGVSNTLVTQKHTGGSASGGRERQKISQP